MYIYVVSVGEDGRESVGVVCLFDGLFFAVAKWRWLMGILGEGCTEEVHVDVVG